MKQCIECGSIKDKSSFSKRAKASDGLKNTCKACDKLKNQLYYQQNPDKFKDNAAAFREVLTQIVKEAKSVPCMDCGESYPYYVMDFDHRPGEVKIGNVAEIAYQRSKRKLLDEIAKCDVVCSNCHRVRTYKRLTQSSTDAKL